ncbi:MAG: hypothetical protein ACR2QQ_12890 [Gammaproteobacteria bacterium]
MNLRQTLPVFAFSLIAATVSTNAAAEERTFHNPSAEGYRVDFCSTSGRNCGERIATEWCVTRGFEYASAWEVDSNIGDLQPTFRMDSQTVCRDRQCDGFTEITCGREIEQFSVPDLGIYTRSTVFTPDGRQAAPTVATNEVTLVVPGCTQYEPGELLCQTLDNYDHCRGLLQEGYGLRCHAALNLDESVPNLEEAQSGSFDLSLRGRPTVTVSQGLRGEGKIRGTARYRVDLEIPDHDEGLESCVQRDHYEYHQTGPDAGVSAISPADDCRESLEGRFSPNEDDLLYAYDVCEVERAWGREVESTSDLIVASVFHFSAATASADDRAPNKSRTVAPYLSISAPIEIVCDN